MSLYEQLDVTPNASAADIKRAYRRKAQKHHPDRQGGSEDKFRSIQLAYDVLGNRGRRAIYDQTGNIPPQSSDTEVLSDIASLLLQLIEKEDIRYIDLIDTMRKHVNAAKQQAMNSMREAQQKIDKNRLAIGRLKRKGEGPNTLAQIVEAHIKKTEQQIDSIKAQIDKFDRITEALRDYSYLFEQQAQIMYFTGPFGATSSATW